MNNLNAMRLAAFLRWKQGVTFRSIYLEKCSGENDDRGCSISRHDILTLAELHEHLCSGMARLQMLHNCGAVVRDEHLLKLEGGTTYFRFESNTIPLRQAFESSCPYHGDQATFEPIQR